MTRAARTAAIRSSLRLALGWGVSLTYKELAEAAGCTPRQARYHAERLAAGGEVVLERDARGRVLVTAPVDLTRWARPLPPSARRAA